MPAFIALTCRDQKWHLKLLQSNENTNCNEIGGALFDAVVRMEKFVLVAELIGLRKFTLNFPSREATRDDAISSEDRTKINSVEVILEEIFRDSREISLNE